MHGYDDARVGCWVLANPINHLLCSGIVGLSSRPVLLGSRIIVVAGISINRDDMIPMYRTARSLSVVRSCPPILHYKHVEHRLGTPSHWQHHREAA